MPQTRCRERVSRRKFLSGAVALLLAGACERKTEPPESSPTEWREFDGSWNAAGNRRSIPLGTDRKASSIELRGTMLLTGTGRPGVGFLSEVIALVDTESGLVGRSVWTDERGNQVFSELKGEGTKEKNHCVGNFLGGTGGYVGVTGTYEFSWEYMIESEDGTIQGRAVGLKGRFKVGHTTSGGAK